jgi:hypothetical protein
MARATLSQKIPDLDTLQLLRGASVTLVPAAIARLDGVLLMPASRAPVPPLASAEALATAEVDAPPGEFMTQVEFTPPAVSCWQCSHALPTGRTVNFCPFCGADQRPPECPKCHAAVERDWRHCPECGERLAGAATA